MRQVFDGFEIDPQECRLLRDGQEVAIERRALEMLSYLVANPGRLVRKEELIQEVWKARSLSQGVLANTVRKLRLALGQAADAREPIETVHGRGYRFHAHLREAPSTPPHANVEPVARALEPWIGRERVLQTFDELLAQAAHGLGKLLVLSGEAGIGKTRSLRELKQRARACGFSVWEGAAYDNTGAPPYWPWVEVLRASHADLSAERWQHHVPSEPVALARLVPHLVTAPSAASAADLQSLRFQLFDELTLFLRSVSSEQPRLVVLDDLHWADAGTIELIAHVARALASTPILLAVTLRERDPALDEPRRAALRRLADVSTQIRLRGLAVAEIGALVAGLYPNQHVPGDVAQTLLERTRGNPFFIRQILHLMDQRELTLAATTLRALELPTAVSEVVRQRIATLDAGTRHVLACAAVIGSEFDISLLSQVLSLSPSETLTRLEPARQIGLLERHPSIAQRLCFDHALLRDALCEELALKELGALHRKLTDALVARAGSADSCLLADVARHALGSLPFELENCLAHCQRAADAARSASGFEVAAEILSRALERLLNEGGDDGTRCELSLQLGIDQYYAGNLTAAYKTLDQGAQLAHALARRDLLPHFAFRLIDCAEGGGGEEGLARTVLEQALAIVGEHEPPMRALLLAHRAELAYELPFAARISLLDQAEHLAASATPAEQLEIANSRAALRDPTQIEQSWAAAQRLRELAKAQNASGNVRIQMRSFAAEFSAYVSALTAGDLARADDVAIAARTHAAQSRFVPAVLMGELMRAGRALGDARFDDLAQSMATLRDLCAHVTGGLAHVGLYYSLLSAQAQGSLASLPAAALPPPQRIGTPRLDARMLIGVAYIFTHLKQEDRARAALALVPRAELSLMPVSYGDLGTLCQLAETCVTLGERSAAREVYAQLLPHAERNAVGTCLEYFGSVAHYLGLLAQFLGKRAESARRFAQAQRANEHLRMPVHTALSRQCAVALEAPATGQRLGE